mgnify:CR=1 FL=1
MAKKKKKLKPASKEDLFPATMAAANKQMPVDAEGKPLDYYDQLGVATDTYVANEKGKRAKNKYEKGRAAYDAYLGGARDPNTTEAAVQFGIDFPREAEEAKTIRKRRAQGFDTDLPQPGDNIARDDDGRVLAVGDIPFMSDAEYERRKRGSLSAEDRARINEGSDYLGIDRPLLELEQNKQENSRKKGTRRPPQFGHLDRTPQFQNIDRSQKFGRGSKRGSYRFQTDDQGRPTGGTGRDKSRQGGYRFQTDDVGSPTGGGKGSPKGSRGSVIGSSPNMMPGPGTFKNASTGVSGDARAFNTTTPGQVDMPADAVPTPGAGTPGAETAAPEVATPQQQPGTMDVGYSTPVTDSSALSERDFAQEMRNPENSNALIGAALDAGVISSADQESLNENLRQIDSIRNAPGLTEQERNRAIAVIQGRQNKLLQGFSRDLKKGYTEDQEKIAERKDKARDSAAKRIATSIWAKRNSATTPDGQNWNIPGEGDTEIQVYPDLTADDYAEAYDIYDRQQTAQAQGKAQAAGEVQPDPDVEEVQQTQQGFYDFSGNTAKYAGDPTLKRYETIRAVVESLGAVIIAEVDPSEVNNLPRGMPYSLSTGFGRVYIPSPNGGLTTYYYDSDEGAFFKERADNTSMNPAETFAPNQDVEEPEVEERDESVYDNIEIFK